MKNYTYSLFLGYCHVALHFFKLYGVSSTKLNNLFLVEVTKY